MPWASLIWMHLYFLFMRETERGILPAIGETETLDYTHTPADGQAEEESDGTSFCIFLGRK